MKTPSKLGSQNHNNHITCLPFVHIYIRRAKLTGRSLKARGIRQDEFSVHDRSHWLGELLRLNRVIEPKNRTVMTGIYRRQVDQLIPLVWILHVDLGSFPNALVNSLVAGWVVGCGTGWRPWSSLVERSRARIVTAYLQTTCCVRGGIIVIRRRKQGRKKFGQRGFEHGKAGADDAGVCFDDCPDGRSECTTIWIDAFGA